MEIRKGNNSEGSILTPIDQYVIDKVREIRKSKKITQEQIADFLKVSEGYIGQIESTKFIAKYNLEALNQLAKLFECSPKDFLPENPL